MKSILVSKGDKIEVIAFYESQKIRLTAELKHVESFLRKLHGQNRDNDTGVLLTRKGQKARKRGPKSVWGKFILEKLKQNNCPMRYSDLIQLAMHEGGRSASEMSKIRASILNSAFRLRAIQGKIATVGEDGKKDKFLVLRSWLDEQGNVRKEDKKWLKDHHSFYPRTVELSSLASPKYAEDLN